MKKKIKIIVALVIGFAVAMILMSVVIYFGYINAYSTSVDTLTVKILGIPLLSAEKTPYIFLSVVGVMIETVVIMAIYSLLIEKKYKKQQDKFKADEEVVCHEKNFENIVDPDWNRFSDLCSSDRDWIIC